jgi:hypothetical protein
MLGAYCAAIEKGIGYLTTLGALNIGSASPYNEIGGLN